MLLQIVQQRNRQKPWINSLYLNVLSEIGGDFAARPFPALNPPPLLHKLHRTSTGLGDADAQTWLTDRSQEHRSSWAAACENRRAISQAQGRWQRWWHDSRSARGQAARCGRRGSGRAGQAQQPCPGLALVHGTRWGGVAAGQHGCGRMPNGRVGVFTGQIRLRSTCQRRYFQTYKRKRKFHSPYRWVHFVSLTNLFNLMRELDLFV